MNKLFLGTLLFLVTTTFSYQVFAERTLRLEIDINASIEDCWKAFTTENGYEAWAVNDAVIEMKMFGKFWTNYTEMVGGPGTIKNTVLSYVPYESYALKPGFPDDFKVLNNENQLVAVPEVVNAETLFGVTQFRKLGPNKTKVISIGVGYQDGAEWDYTYRTFKIWNSYSLKLAKAYLERKSSEKK